jgi:hypothetical protein
MNYAGTLSRSLSVAHSTADARLQLACALGDVGRPCPRPATLAAFFHSCEFRGHRLVTACQVCVDGVVSFGDHPTRCTGCGRRMTTVAEWIHGIGPI